MNREHTLGILALMTNKGSIARSEIIKEFIPVLLEKIENGECLTEALNLFINLLKWPTEIDFYI